MSDLHFLRLQLSKGIGANMLKIGAKRRRTKTEIVEECEEERVKQEAIEDKISQYDQMMARIQQLEGEVQNNQSATQILSGLIERKQVVMDLNGNYTTEQQPDASILGSQYNDWAPSHVRTLSTQADRVYLVRASCTSCIWASQTYAFDRLGAFLKL